MCGWVDTKNAAAAMDTKRGTLHLHILTYRACATLALLSLSSVSFGRLLYISPSLSLSLSPSLSDLLLYYQGVQAGQADGERPVRDHAGGAGGGAGKLRTRDRAGVPEQYVGRHDLQCFADAAVVGGLARRQGRRVSRARARGVCVCVKEGV